MMPRQADAATLVPDEPIPEVDAELEAEVPLGEYGLESFLHAVRALVHGEGDPAGIDEPAADSPDRAVPEEDLGDWLPGVWTVDEPGPRRRASRRARRRERRQDAARAIAATVPAVATAPVPGTGRGHALSRRERRHEAALRKQIARAVVEGPTADPTAPADEEDLTAYLARVEASRLPRRSRPRARRARRTAAVTAVVVLIAGAAVVPWAAPSVPRFFADLVPGQGSTVTHVEDPPVDPSTEAFTGPVGIKQQAGPYAGVRLQAAGPPREVRVPRLHVDSGVVPISGQSGSLVPPPDPQTLGWWQEGKPVGAQYGTAVVTGHTVHTGGGALDHLDKLVVGDSLSVRTDRGWIRYVVQRTHVYSTEDLARDADKIFRLGGTGRLVVITCDNWNGSFYESNAVVFAVPVSDEPFAGSTAGAVPDAGPSRTTQNPSGNMDRYRGVVFREDIT